jgi:hypothetical protein
MTKRSNEPTPLDVLEHAMWSKWTSGDLDGAVAIARIAAPYRHPKCPSAASARRVETDLQLLDDEELLERLAEARRRVIDQKEPAEQPAGLGN